ncbi:MAG: hypothetical protein V2I33_06520 [Kangiellaceae bacterium]|jgi:hypothetical protein|nr:hypothetical protein [Kangiellaceae bacterium]
MKRVLIFVVFSVLLNVSYGDEVKKIAYPQLPNLSIVVPQDWVSYEKRIFGVEPPNREIDVAGTVYSAKGNTLDNFTATKHSAIQKRMSWYSPVTELVKTNDYRYQGYIQEYKGVWPEEKEPTSYIVTTFEIDGYMLSLTFTSLTSKIDGYRKQIQEILKSIELKK